MKRETTNKKLNELLGISEDTAAEIQKKIEAKKGNVVGISEEEIQDFRQAEGVAYFLLAPELFHARVCKNCGEPFLVSRLHVAYCSYDCISSSIWKLYGVVWSRESELVTDPEHFIKEVYEGNEPLWIRNLSILQKALTVVTDALTPKASDDSENSDTTSSKVVTSNSVESTPSSTPLPQKIPIPKLR